MELMLQNDPVSTHGSQLWKVWGVSHYPWIAKTQFQDTPPSVLARYECK